MHKLRPRRALSQKEVYMQKITPNIWFNGNAEEAVELYISAFSDGRVVETVHYPKSAEEGLADFQAGLAGRVLSIDFELGDMRFTAINAGPEFRPNPSISFMVNFDPSRDDRARSNLDALWERLSDGGIELMPLDKYDFSQHYGWVEDRYGVSWQLILTDPDGEPRPFIIPALMFAGPQLGRATEARNYYVEVFADSKLGEAYKYTETTDMFTKDHIMFSELQLADQWLVMNDGGPQQDFTFNEGVSLAVMCRDQAEIDRLWDKLSSHPDSEQCGWCKDKFGVSWQIVPENMGELMSRPGAYQTMMEQKKIIIAEY